MTNTLASFKRNLHVGGAVIVKSALYPERDGRRVVLALHQRTMVTGIPTDSMASLYVEQETLEKPVIFAGKSYLPVVTIYQPAKSCLVTTNATVLYFMAYRDKEGIMQPSPDFTSDESWLQITIEK